MFLWQGDKYKIKCGIWELYLLVSQKYLCQGDEYKIKCEMQDSYLLVSSFNVFLIFSFSRKISIRWIQDNYIPFVDQVNH